MVQYYMYNAEERSFKEFWLLHEFHVKENLCGWYLK